MKTPKEQAKELVDEFLILQISRDSIKIVSKKLAKQCAIIAADLLIDHLPPLVQFKSGISEVMSEYCMEYWIEVKNELLKQESL